MEYQKIKDHAHLVRDLKSNAIINISADIHHAKLAQKRRIRKQNEEMAQLKNEISEIKSMLYNLINNKNDQSK